jgi:hypothetical protein
MNKEVFNWEKVSFSEYLNKDGRIIKTLGFKLVGEVLLFNNTPLENINMGVASVSCADGELYFVPLDSLVFLKENE